MYSLSYDWEDKTRPLSTLANLAIIIITDVQDMDPIFINLPAAPTSTSILLPASIPPRPL